MKVLTDEKALELAKKLLGNDKAIRDVLVAAIKKAISDCKEYSDSLAVNYDPAGTAAVEVQNLAKGQVKKNKDILDVLIGTGEGSIEKRVADAVASIVADAPDALDTLKEISDWIFEHEDDASAMNSGIATNKREIEKLAKLIGTLPEDAGIDTIVEYIDSLGIGYATAEQGKKADTAIQTVVTGTENGTIAVDGEDVEVKGLGNSAFGNIFTGTRKDYEIAVSSGEIKENTIVNITDDEEDIVMGLKKANEEISKIKVVAEPYFLQYGVSTVEEAIEAYRDGKELIAWEQTSSGRLTLCGLTYIDGGIASPHSQKLSVDGNYVFKFSAYHDVAQENWVLGTKSSPYSGWRKDNQENIYTTIRDNRNDVNRELSNISKQLLNFKSQRLNPDEKFYITQSGIYLFAGYDYNLNLYNEGSLVGKSDNLITALFVAYPVAFYGKTYKGTLGVSSAESSILNVNSATKNLYVHNANTSHEARVFYLKAGE